MSSAKVQQSVLGIKKSASKAPASKSATSKATASKAAAAASKVAAASKKDDPFVVGFDLQTKPAPKTLKIEKKNITEEKNFPINDARWVQFFYEYIQYIENNIGECLSKIPGHAPLKVCDLSKTDLAEGGFDKDLDIDKALDYNIGLYELLFTQFKDGTNKINSCTKLNLLLKYVGEAVLTIAQQHKNISIDELKEFYRKIAVILELAVYPEVFLHYMARDSKGVNNKVNFKIHNRKTHAWYNGIWIRKQEYLGIVSKSEGRDYLKKIDTGLRGFVRNYIRRIIIYMRVNNTSYPLGYELPYNWSHDPQITINNPPLPKDGVYKFNKPKEDYHICRDDWKYIPDFLLPKNGEGACSLRKEYIDPSGWNKPPPEWWIKRTKELLGFAWWEKGVNIEAFRERLAGHEEIVEEMKAKLVEGKVKLVRVRVKIVGTKALAKWKKLNCILEENYYFYETLWEEEFKTTGIPPEDSSGEEMEGGGGFVYKRASKFSSKKSPFNLEFNKRFVLEPKIRKELIMKLNEYLKEAINETTKNGCHIQKSTKSATAAKAAKAATATVAAATAATRKQRLSSATARAFTV